MDLLSVLVHIVAVPGRLLVVLAVPKPKVKAGCKGQGVVDLQGPAPPASPCASSISFAAWWHIDS